MVKKVQQIHDVLWLVMYRVCGKQYTGIGAMTEMRVIAEIVNGNPRLCGHLL